MIVVRRRLGRVTSLMTKAHQHRPPFLPHLSAIGVLIAMREPEFNAILSQLQSQPPADLSADQMRGLIAWFLSGEASEDQTLLFLERHSQKGESIDELVGAAQALRSSMKTIQCPHEVVVDTCGTGGDGSKTFNISTAAAIACAAAGTPVAKHGNRKVTSSTGSADVLSELGVNLEATAPTVESCLDQLGICFLFAPHFHPAMKHVGPARRALGRPSIFNRLGPLANPAQVGYQVLGVGDLALQDKLAAALQKLGTKRSIVVRSEDGVDEISLSTATRVLEVTSDSIVEHRWSPSDFGVAEADRDELFADDPASSAACIRSVLAGEKSPKRDVVVLNAAAALWIAGRADELDACARLVEAALDAGTAQAVVERLGQQTSASS
ncbi:MAG: anthranilate phosphoribosyltransferase [Planctomycetota bacterium]